MKLNLGFCIILTAVLLVACQSEQVQQTSDVTADASRIKSHIRFLSDDLLEGRDTGARGHEIASLYIATEFEKYGLTPAQAIQSATINAADLIGVRNKLGSIAQGKWADIVAVDGNPEQDISVLEKKIKFVMKDGKVYLQK